MTNCCWRMPSRRKESSEEKGREAGTNAKDAAPRPVLGSFVLDLSPAEWETLSARLAPAETLSGKLAREKAEGMAGPSEPVPAAPAADDAKRPAPEGMGDRGYAGGEADKAPRRRDAQEAPRRVRIVVVGK